MILQTCQLCPPPRSPCAAMFRAEAWDSVSALRQLQGHWSVVSGPADVFLITALTLCYQAATCAPCTVGRSRWSSSCKVWQVLHGLVSELPRGEQFVVNWLIPCGLQHRALHTLSLAVAQRAQPSRSTTHQVSYFCLGVCDVICNSNTDECCIGRALNHADSWLCLSNAQKAADPNQPCLVLPACHCKMVQSTHCSKDGAACRVPDIGWAPTGRHGLAWIDIRLTARPRYAVLGQLYHLFKVNTYGASPPVSSLESERLWSLLTYIILER